MPLEGGTTVHRIGSFIVAVGLLLAPSTVRAQAEAERKEKTFQVVKKGAAVGDVDETVSQMEMRLRLVVRGPDAEPEVMELSNVSSDRYTQTVLAARKGFIERVKVSYGDAYEESMEDGKRQRKTSPVSGKVYIGGLVKGRVVVTDEAGKPVSKEEQELVEDALPVLGKEDPLDAALPDTPIRVGDSLDRFAKVFEREMFPQDDPTMRFHDTQVRLAEATRDARGSVGTFRVTTTLTIKDPENPVVMTFPMEGTFSLLAEGGRGLDFTLSGPVRVAVSEELRKQGVTVEAEGDVNIHVNSPAP